MNKKMPMVFFIVAFLWSWIFWGFSIIVVNMFDRSVLLDRIVYSIFLIGLFGPGIGAFFSINSLEEKGSIKKFIKSFLSLNFGWKTWFAIIAGFGIITFSAWVTPEYFGEERLPLGFSNLYLFPVYLVIILFFTTFFVGGNEEIGWRGYIMPYFEKSYGLIIGSLILGIIWVIWHIPMWFIPVLNHVYMNFFCFMLMCIGLSYVFSWVIEASENRLFSGLIVHGTVNAYFTLFPVIIREINNKQIRFLIYSIIVFVFGMIIVIVRTIKKQIKPHLHL
jgi:membrane protease YdiL (CAAX protease family)